MDRYSSRDSLGDLYDSILNYIHSEVQSVALLELSALTFAQFLLNIEIHFFCQSFNLNLI